MTKTDEILLELNRTFADYIENIGEFEHEDKTYKIAHYFIPSPPMQCNICGTYPKHSIFMIKRKSDSKELSVGNRCIDRITNKNVAEKFKAHIRKRKNVIANRKYVDGIYSIIVAQKKNKLSFQITKEDTKKLQKALERMSKGLKLTRTQEQLAKCYITQTSQNKMVI
jgi:hypothetical protein